MLMENVENRVSGVGLLHIHVEKVWRGNVCISETFKTCPIDWLADLHLAPDMSFDFWVNAAHSSDGADINQKSEVNKSNYSSFKDRSKSNF